MAFHVDQDVRWAFAGQTVTLEGDSLAGNRARFQLTAKPHDSTLELYDADVENYLAARGEQRCEITPDVAGTYTIRAVDETVTVNVKHFSNDGGSAQSKGIATATVVGSSSYTLTVGDVLQREFGLAADKVTLTVKVHASSSTSGPLTYHAGSGYLATLTGSTSPVMDMAVRSTGVTRVMNYYGMGSGYTDTNHILDWSTFTEQPATTLSRIVTGFNKHVLYTTCGVHDVADTTNTMAGTAVPTTVTGLGTYCDTFTTKYNSHLALGAGAAHPNGADITNTCATTTCNTLAKCITRATLLKVKLDAHKIRVATGHYTGDNEEEAITPWYTPNSNDSTSTVITFTHALAHSFDAHLANNGQCNTYHLATGGANNAIARTGTTWDELQELANDAATKFEAHCANRVFDTGSAATYHTYVDKSGVLPFRASDRLTTVQLIDHLLWAYLNHTVYGSNDWHANFDNAGAAYVEPYYATSRLQLALLDRLNGNDTSTPPNTMTGVNNLINYAAFTKAP
jgi:hypothetical protein